MKIVGDRSSRLNLPQSTTKKKSDITHHTMTAATPTATETQEEAPDSTPKYPYNALLDQLESKAYQSLSRTADPNTKDSTESSPWDLSHDALLATLLHEFTNHIVQRTHAVSTEVQKLQSSVNKVGVDVATVQNEWMKCSRTIVMEQVVTEDESSESDSSDDKNNEEQTEQAEGKEIGSDDDSAAEIARLEEEEKSAIQDGMKALSLFYDAKQAMRASDGTGDEIGLDNDEYLNSFDAEDDVMGDNCYYYPSADGDVFNQRPLPFIVGSREFMESSSAGLDAVENTGDNVA